MPLKKSTIYTPTLLHILIHNRFFYHEAPNSDKLLVILPGRGYLSEHPLLYHLRKVALGLGYDVLSVQYSFQVAPKRIRFDLAILDTRVLYNEVGHPVEEVLERGYAQICIAGKSLGTPLAVTHAQRLPAEIEKRLLLLTPIGSSVKDAGDIRTLAVIGDKDTFFNAKAIEADANRPNVEWRIFEGLGHPLEVDDDWRASLEVLTEIMGVCEAFLADTEC